jgi:O-antigen/teichoic acid export membrane protein
MANSDQPDLHLIKRRSVSGVVALTLRTFFLQAVNTVSLFILTVLLTPGVFGVFFVVSAAINFLIYFSDIGLAAALVQKKEKVTRLELVTTFTIQQALVVTLVVVSLVLSPLVGSFYQLSPAAVWLFRSFAVSFFLSSLKTIPSVLLERKLGFSRLVIPQIVETVVFNLVAVVLAWQGYGVTSFTVAVLARGLSGVAAMYLVNPWRPGLGFSAAAARGLLRFGVPFQVNSLLALVKDDLQTVFLGRVLVLAQVGFLGWAQKWAFMPLRLLMDNVNKVTFPTFSRLQDDLASLKAATEKALFVVCAATLPVLVGLAVSAEPLVAVIPRYHKWEPALWPLYLYAFNAAFATFSSTLTNVLNATGRVKLTLKLMLMWTGLTWIFVPPLVFRLGYVGAAAASAIIALSSLVTVFLVRRIFVFDFVRTVLAPALASVIMGLGLYLWTRRVVGGLGGLVSGAFLGTLAYFLLLLVLSRGRLKKEMRWAVELFSQR